MARTAGESAYLGKKTIDRARLIAAYNLISGADKADHLEVIRGLIDREFKRLKLKDI